MWITRLRQEELHRLVTEKVQKKKSKLMLRYALSLERVMYRTLKVVAINP